MQLELSNDERALLKRVVDQAIAELKVEVRRTTTRGYHDDLQRDETMLVGLSQRLASSGG